MAQNTDPYGYVYVFKNEYMPGLKKRHYIQEMIINNKYFESYARKITQETEEDGKEVLANRKPNLNLDDILVENAEVELRDSHGEIVKDENGNPVKAVYRGRNKFECKGVISHSSPLALKFLTDYAGMKRTSINGNEHWYYEGRKLTSYRM